MTYQTGEKLPGGEYDPDALHLVRRSPEIEEVLRRAYLVRRKGRSRAALFVYFAFAMESGRIKIGIAADPWERLAQLQTGCPEDLSLLGFMRNLNAERVETILHERFAAHRLRGEWFACVDEIVDFITAESCHDWDWLNEMLGR